MCQGSCWHQYKSGITLGKVSGTSKRAIHTYFQMRWLPWKGSLQDIWSTLKDFDLSCTKALADPSLSQLRPLKGCQNVQRRVFSKKLAVLKKNITNFGAIYKYMDSSRIKVLTKKNKNQQLTSKRGIRNVQKKKKRNYQRSIFFANSKCP